MRARLALVLVLVGALSCDNPRAKLPKPPVQDDPTAVVKYLLSLPHGPDRTNERGRQLLAQMAAQPEGFVAAIRAELQIPDDANSIASASNPDWNPATALRLAKTLGKEQGGPLIRRFFDTTQDRIARLTATSTAGGDAPEPNRAAALRILRGLRSAALRALESFHDSYAVESVLRTIEQTAQTVRVDPGQVIMLEYLRTVAPRNPEVYRRLREMADDPKSPLHTDRAFEYNLTSFAAELGGEKEPKP